MRSFLYAIAVLLGFALPCLGADVLVDDFYLGTDPAGLADYLATSRAITAAGVGGTVQFTGGSSYALPGSLVPLAGQTLTSVGGVATLRRADAIRTTLAANATTGSNFIDVADGSRFQAGWDISPLVTGGAGGRPDGEPLLTRIVSIDGNRLYLNRTISQDYQAGDAVVNTPRLILMQNPGTTISNLKIDGNRAGNADWVSWATHMDVHVSSSNQTVTGVEFVDSTGTPLYVQGNGVDVNNSQFFNSALGNFHFSGASNVVIDGVVSRGANVLGALGGHSTSAFEWSQANTGIVIRNSLIEEVMGYAFGAMAPYNGNSDITIENNTLLNNAGVLEGYAPAAGVGNRSLELNFIGNDIIDSGDLRLINIDPLQPIVDLAIDDNRWWDSRVLISYVDDASLIDNIWYADDGRTLADFLLVTDPGAGSVLSGNVVVVPEPAAWLLAILGCALAAPVYRRRRARQS